jgi:hypothetical protein
MWPAGLTAEQYAVITAVAQTPWDLNIHFGQVDAPVHRPEVAGVVDIQIRPIVSVRIPMASAKILRDQLTQQIEVYEKANGPIKVGGVSLLDPQGESGASTE